MNDAILRADLLITQRTMELQKREKDMLEVALQTLTQATKVLVRDANDSVADFAIANAEATLNQTPFQRLVGASDDLKKDAWLRGTPIRIEHDGFEGVVLGPYKTLEGKIGQVCQLKDARVIHVYGQRWLQRMEKGE